MKGLTIRRFHLALLAFALGLAFSPSARANDAAANYKAKCVACHGAGGKADVPAGKALKARDFHDADVQKETDDELATIIAKGKNKMPGYEKQLKPDEIKALVAFVRELGKK